MGLTPLEDCEPTLMMGLAPTQSATESTALLMGLTPTQSPTESTAPLMGLIPTQIRL